MMAQRYLETLVSAYLQSIENSKNLSRNVNGVEITWFQHQSKWGCHTASAASGEIKELKFTHVLEVGVFRSVFMAVP